MIMHMYMCVRYSIGAKTGREFCIASCIHVYEYCCVSCCGCERTMKRRCNLGGGPGSAPRCDMRGAACNH